MESHESSSWQFHVNDEFLCLAVLCIGTLVRRIYYVGQIPLKAGIWRFVSFGVRQSPLLTHYPTHPHPVLCKPPPHLYMALMFGSFPILLVSSYVAFRTGCVRTDSTTLFLAMSLAFQTCISIALKTAIGGLPVRRCRWLWKFGTREVKNSSLNYCVVFTNCRRLHLCASRLFIVWLCLGAAHPRWSWFESAHWRFSRRHSV